MLISVSEILVKNTEKEKKKKKKKKTIFIINTKYC
jgi:hypothetical protein